MLGKEKIGAYFGNLKSEKGRSLLGNFISLTALQVSSLLLSFLSLPYVLRVIGIDYYGIVAIAMSLMYYFSSVTDFSFSITATRDVSIHRNNKKALSYIYSKVMYIKASLFLFSLAIIMIIVYSYKPFFQHSLIYFITAFSLCGNVLFPEWFFQGIEKMRFITFVKVSVQIFSTILIFVLIKQRSDYWIYPLLNTSSGIVSGIIGITILFKKFKVRFIRVNFQRLFSTVKTNFPIFVNQFVPTMYNNTSTFLLGFWVDGASAGVYAVIKKVVDISIVTINTFSRVFFPFLNRHNGAFELYRKMTLLLTLSIILLLLICNRLIFDYLNINIELLHFMVLFFLAASMVGLAYYDMYGLNYLIVLRKDKLVMKNTLRVSIIGFMTSFLLIPVLGILGSALNLFMSRILLGLTMYSKHLKFKV